MRMVMASKPELFYLRCLLSHVPGAMSFEDLRTVDGVVLPTFVEAARALNLIVNDECNRLALVEVRHLLSKIKLAHYYSIYFFVFLFIYISQRQFQNIICKGNVVSERPPNPCAFRVHARVLHPSQRRRALARIQGIECIFGSDLRLNLMEEIFQPSMCDDLLHKVQTVRKSATIEDVMHEALNLINQNLQFYGHSLDDHESMPKPDPTKIGKITREIEHERLEQF